LGPGDADNSGPRVSSASQGLGQACPEKSGISYPRKSILGLYFKLN